MKKIRYVLTGATGLIGMNLLWEILKNHRSHLEGIQVFVLGRQKRGVSLQDRMTRFLMDDGLAYITKDPAERDNIRDLFSKVCVFIDFDLTANTGRITRANMQKLQQAPIDYFFHMGASTDLRDGSVVEGLLLRTNIQGTQNVLALISELEIGLFSYVGTAYSCGDVEGEVRPDYVNIRQTFRNPYERTKLLAEMMVREYARATGTRIKIFRPSVTGGRLLEEPIGSVNKFDVFYGFAAFFLAVKRKHIPSHLDVYSTPLPLDVQICFNRDSGLNIVPVDFIAKAMFLITTKDMPSDSFHMVSRNAFSHEQYVAAMFDFLKISHYRFVSKVPAVKNNVETLYYRTAGKILTPYVSAKETRFLVSNYDQEIRKYGLEVPVMDLVKFNKLLEFARGRDFGLERASE
jgi:nucleoside-diphosphate-sugar epimerase